jgi:hypothetical protein
MNQTIKLTKAQAKNIVNATFPDYTGRKFKLEISDTISFYDLNWSGGTCNKFVAVANGEIHGMFVPAPWKNTAEGQTVDLPSEIVVVEHSFFCGHDMGITIHINPANTQKWLEA